MTTVRGDIKSELGQKLQNYRTDRPDEWTMDEFTRAAETMQDRIVELENNLRYLIEAEWMVSPDWSDKRPAVIAAAKKTLKDKTQ